MCCPQQNAPRVSGGVFCSISRHCRSGGGRALVQVAATLFAGLLGAVFHELVKLCLVLGFAQALQEVFELFLLFFQAAQRVGLVAVEGRVSRRAEGMAMGTGTGAAASTTGGQTGKTSGDYYKGMAVFTVAKGGLMYEASIGGQKFTYTPK
mgnify:CR=1 FL=1